MAPIVHGATISDYYRCRKVNEVACTECKAAASAYERGRRKKNPARHRELDKAWRDANVEKAREIEKRYRDSHPEVQRRKKRQYRARKYGSETEKYTTQDILDLYGSDCHICFEPIDLEASRSCGSEGWEKSLHLDHLIPLIKGGTDLKDNIRPAHASCNIRKQATLLEGPSATA
jgi:hypothetical protein